jgi:hypothetical protein
MMLRIPGEKGKEEIWATKREVEERWRLQFPDMVPYSTTSLIYLSQKS